MVPSWGAEAHWTDQIERIMALQGTVFMPPNAHTVESYKFKPSEPVIDSFSTVLVPCEFIND